MTYFYTAYGLTFSLPVEYSRLQPIPSLNEIDLNIEFCGQSSVNYENSVQAENPQDVTLTFKDVAKFHIQNGCKISITTVPNVEMDAVFLYLFGSGFGAVLYQRGYFVLHGCTIEHNGACHTFVGHSKVGKSTLAACFIAKGYNVISDDVCAVQFIDQKLYVFPGFPDIKLWQETLENFNLPYAHLAPIRKDINKYYVPLSDWKSTPIPLHSVTQLNIGHDFKIDKITQMPTKFGILLHNSYRCEILAWRNLIMTILFNKKIARLLNQITVYDITRPQDGFQLDELTALVQENIFALETA